MEEPANRAKFVRQRMEQTRSQLYRNVGDLLRNARETVDWRRMVSRYPWAAVTATAAVGFFLVPSRRKVTHLDAETLAALARDKRLVLRVEEHPSKPAALKDTLLATILAVAGRGVAAWGRKQVIDLLNQEVFGGQKNEFVPRRQTANDIGEGTGI